MESDSPTTPNLKTQIGQFRNLLTSLSEGTGLTLDELYQVSELLSKNAGKPAADVPPVAAAPASPPHAITTDVVNRPVGREVFVETVARILGDRNMSVKEIIAALKSEKHKTSKTTAPAQAIARVFREHPDRFQRTARGRYQNLIRGVEPAGEAAMAKATLSLKQVPPLDKQLRVLRGLTGSFLASDLVPKLGIHDSQVRGVMNHLHANGYIVPTGQTSTGAKRWRKTGKVKNSS